MESQYSEIQGASKGRTQRRQRIIQGVRVNFCFAPEPNEQVPTIIKNLLLHAYKERYEN